MDRRSEFDRMGYKILFLISTALGHIYTTLAVVKELVD